MQTTVSFKRDDDLSPRLSMILMLVIERRAFKLLEMRSVAYCYLKTVFEVVVLQFTLNTFTSVKIRSVFSKAKFFFANEKCLCIIRALDWVSWSHCDDAVEACPWTYRICHQSHQCCWFDRRKELADSDLTELRASSFCIVKGPLEVAAVEDRTNPTIVNAFVFSEKIYWNIAWRLKIQ